MSSLSGLGVCIRVNDFSSKTTKHRAMFFLKKQITYLLRMKNGLRHADLFVHLFAGATHPKCKNFNTLLQSGGYYGFRFVMPTTPPQCVERFHCYRSNDKNLIARLLKFAGYIHNHKILPGNIFGLILKNEMAATRVFRLSAKTFAGPLEQRVL